MIKQLEEQNYLWKYNTADILLWFCCF